MPLSRSRLRKEANESAQTGLHVNARREVLDLLCLSE